MPQLRAIIRLWDDGVALEKCRVLCKNSNDNTAQRAWAMCLLPIHDLPRPIFLDARDVTTLLISKWAKQPASSAKCDKGDYKSIIRNADACPCL
jgi:hypothetical protein